jgi:uncharacterized membrane protein
MKENNKKRALLAASVAGLLAVTGTLVSSHAVYAEEIHCYGVNACKGTGDCGGKGHSCAGKNACKGRGFLNFPSEDLCLKVQGGSLTPLAG